MGWISNNGTLCTQVLILSLLKLLYFRLKAAIKIYKETHPWCFSATSFWVFQWREMWEHCVGCWRLIPLCVQSLPASQPRGMCSWLLSSFTTLLSFQWSMPCCWHSEWWACLLPQEQKHPSCLPRRKVPCTLQLPVSNTICLTLSYSVSRGVSHEVLLSRILAWKWCYWI